MKKVFIASVMAVAAVAMSAQSSLVKEVEHTIKGKSPDYQQAMKQLKPALTNPESASDVETWVLAGKISTTLYDNMFKQQATGRPVDLPVMGNALMDGIEYYVTALPLDSVVDAKGKVKAKYSKEILKQINDNYRFLEKTAGDLYNEAKDYNGAYRAWDMMVNLPKNPSLGIKAEPDTVMSMFAFNKGIAAWQADSLDNALKSFRQAIDLGYSNKVVYDYAISVAVQKGDADAVTEIATVAYPLYGNEDPKYLQLMINDKIEKQQYAEAQSMLDQAIAANPDNGFLYYSLAVLEETEGKLDEAVKDYTKAAKLADDNAVVLMNAGRILLLKAQKADEESNQGNYDEVKNNIIVPLYKEAAGYLEKAYEIDPDGMNDAATYLRSIYYYLNDEANFKRFENV